MPLSNTLPPFVYDLRHACVSTWLNGGIAPAQVAEWAGHSVAILLKIYAKCIDGQDDIARRRIEEALGDPGEGDASDEAPGDPSRPQRGLETRRVGEANDPDPSRPAEADTSQGTPPQTPGQE